MKELKQLSREDAVRLVKFSTLNLDDVFIHVENVEIRNNVLCIEWWSLSFDRREWCMGVDALTWKQGDLLRSLGYSLGEAGDKVVEERRDMAEILWEEAKRRYPYYELEEGATKEMEDYTRGANSEVTQHRKKFINEHLWLIDLCPSHPVVVDFEKMGQWIGLIDRNGVKICVGDIVNKEGSKYSRTVKWRSDSALYYMTYTDDEGIERYLTFEPIAKDQVAGEPTRCYNLEVVISERVHLIPNVNNNKETRIGEILTGEQCIGRGYSNDSMGKLIGINRYYADMYNAGLYELGKIDECTIRNWQILEEKDKQFDYLKSHLQSDFNSEEYKKITGWNTPQEMEACEQGKAAQERLIVEFIRKWDGATNSQLGQLLYDKFNKFSSPTSVDAADFDWKKVERCLDRVWNHECSPGTGVAYLKSLPATEQDGEK